MQGKSQVAAAAAAGMSERTARTWKEGLLPSATKAPRDWRTRPDAFAEVWETELVPLLMRDEERVLEARTLLGELKKRHAGHFSEGQIRTLQRRMRDWRALHGPEREVMFPQEHVPGRECAFDFTHGKELGITIRGEVFDHLLFELVLSFSGWTWACVAMSETFEALSMGLQGGAVGAGGTPGGGTLGQSVGGDSRAQADRRADSHAALSGSAGALRHAIQPDPARGVP
jgi:hypothetical protein